jgi:F-type H+-transporting ATPase subunit a
MLFQTFLNYTPLEQFDDVSWVYYDLLLEGVNSYSKYVFELEYDIFSLTTLNGASIFTSLSSTLVVILFLLFIIVGKTFGYTAYISDFSHLFLLAFIHLFTGSVIFFWFDDFVTDVFKASSEENVSSIWNEIGSLHWKSQYSGDVSLIFTPQINFSIVWDENLISFLAAFLLFGGAEEEEDENFILEEEESDFVEDVVAPLFISNLGKDVEDNGALFLKVCGVFGFVLTNNLMGMLPYSDTGTSSLILTFWVALAVFGSLLYIMINKHGVNYLFSLFLPSGAPLALMFLLIPIEFISYTFRLVSLSVRLFANMMAGHTLLKVIVGFSWSMILMGDVFLIANLFPVGILFILTFLEIGVAVIQAYVFTILTCMYLKDIFVAH